jgi:hypothetical protein
MTFDDLISSGWRDHDTATAAVANRLEENASLTVRPEQAARYAALVVHAIGQHHRDWPRAARAASTIERVASDHPGTWGRARVGKRCGRPASRAMRRRRW